MIQLGPLEIDKEILENPIGVKTGGYKRMSTGEELKLSEPINTLRIRFRIKLKDRKYKEIVSFIRNNKYGSVPLYTGHQYIDGLYQIKSMRESSINWKWQEIIILLERRGTRYNKIQEAWLRYDDWNIIYEEDFEDSPAELLNQKVYDDDASALQISTTVYMVGDKGGRINTSGQQYNAILFGFDYWRNYEVGVWVQGDQNAENGLAWKCETGNFQGFDDDLLGNSLDQHRGMHYEIVLDPLNNQIRVEYRDSWDTGEETIDIIYTEDHDDINYDQFYHLKAITINNTHFCYVNGRLITYFEDKRCKGGCCAIFMRSTADCNLYFDDILVREVPVSALVLDESYTEDVPDLVKTRTTTHGQIAYSQYQQVSYKAGAGANCILHLRFDQGFGDKVYDQSRFNHHARVVNGEWKEGYMRFKRDIDGLIVPYDSNLSNKAEGTIIMRMRRCKGPSDDDDGDAIIRRGSTDWSVSLYTWQAAAGTVELGSGAENPDSAAVYLNGMTRFDPHLPDYSWKTFIIRWKDSLGRWETYVNGLGAAADPGGYQKDYGSSTTDDMIIGRANVDIEYLVVYDKWIEYPEIPGGTGVRILDVDSHHEDELLDIRLNEHSEFVREYWSGIAPTFIGSAVYQDYEKEADQRTMLYRRGGHYYAGGSDGCKMTLPDHIKNRMHDSDWTIEHIACGAGTTSQVDSLVIGNSDKSIKTIRISSWHSAGTKGYFYSCYLADASTEEEHVKQMRGSGTGTVIFHLTYQASTRTLKAYHTGEFASELVLSDDIGSTTDTIHIGAGHQAIFYRSRIIGRKLNDHEIREMTDEYMGKAVQVFHQHEFKGSPELDNHLITLRSRADSGDLRYGESKTIEVFDEGTFEVIQGAYGGTLPAKVHDFIRDEEAASSFYVRGWQDNMLVDMVSQDEVIIESRMQTQIRNKEIMSSGLHLNHKTGLAIGLYAVDLHTRVSTRARAWALRVENTDMQAIWREGGHCPREEDTLADQRGNFYAASGNTHNPNMGSSSSFDQLSNLTVMLNLNYDRSSWDNRNYIIGLLPDDIQTIMSVVIASGGTVIDYVSLNDLQRRVGGEFKIAMAFLPYDNTKVFSDISDQSPFSWSATRYGNDTSGSASSAFNDNVMLSDGSYNVASISKAITVDPGTFKLWWNQFGNQDTGRVRQLFRAWTSGTPKIFRHVKYSDTKNEDTDPALWIDSELVVSEDVATEITFEERLRGIDNTPTPIKLDGLVIIPCYNGADFILDQLYSARALKNIKRFSS